MDYKSNSYKNKEQNAIAQTSEKKVEKVISGFAKTKKKSDVAKVADVLISEDIRNVKSYILMDVLVPAIKKALLDIVTNGADMLLYGEAGRTKRSSTSSKISYRNYYERDRRDSNSPRLRSGYDYEDVVLDTRGEAEEVLSNMDELMSRYHIVSVADLYDLVGLSGNYTDCKYGWTDIRNATIVHVKDGYLIRMPKAMPLD